MRATALIFLVSLSACGSCGEGNNDGEGENAFPGGGACDPVQAGCHPDAVCQTRNDDFYCYCPDGFQGDGRRACVELGACDVDPSICADNAFCATRSAGSFCACEEGFSGDGLTCTDIAECELYGDQICGIGTCIEDEGGFRCDCPDGYGGEPCADVDECTEEPDICGAGTCTNDDPGHSCACEAGWEFDGETCVDIDECSTGEATCAGSPNCFNEPGSYRCGCPDGYTGDGEVCTILADCQSNPGACDANASCETSADGDTCRCDEGWAGDGSTCREAGWARLSAGWGMTCGIREDRTLWCWGSNALQLLGSDVEKFSATPVRIAPGRRFKQIDVGRIQACAVAEDGTMWCWDRTTEPLQVGTDADWESVAVSTDHTYLASCGVRTDGTLWCWGSNRYGQLGSEDSTSPDRPVQVGTDTTWKSVDLSATRACGLKRDRTLWCWGGGIVPRPPEQIAGDWSLMALGAEDACAGRPDGSVRCWATAAHDPDDAGWELPGGAVWQALSAGRGHLCGVRNDGAVFCMGNGSHGQIGRLTAPEGDGQWEEIPGGQTYLSVSAGAAHTCAVRTDHQATCWGSNLDGELGTGIAGTSIVPRQVPGPAAYQKVSVGDRHACAVTSGNALHCWGENSVDQAGQGNAERYTLAPSPVVGGAFQLTSAGLDHSCAVSLGGSLFCFGGNSRGQIGDGSTGDTQRGNPDTGTGSWSDVEAGGQFTCGVVGGQVWCWGAGDQGQLGRGDVMSSANPVMIPELTGVTSLSVSSGAHACAIDGTETLYCWGSNTRGQLGDGSGNDQLSPSQVDTSIGWLEVDTGLEHTCGIRRSGGSNVLLFCWGSDESGQLGDKYPNYSPHLPSQVFGSIYTWRNVSAGARHTCAIDGADGSANCWGSNAGGQLGTGDYINYAMVSSVVDPGPWLDISAGTTATCGVKEDGTLWCWGRGEGQLLGDGSAWSLAPLEVALP